MGFQCGRLPLVKRYIRDMAGTAALFFAVTGHNPAVAGENGGAITQAFRTCLTTLADDPKPLADHFHPMVEDVSEGGGETGISGRTLTRVFLSANAPLSLTIEETWQTENGTTTRQAITCSVESVFPERGAFRWRLRPVEIGRIWDDLEPLAPAATQTQIAEIISSLRASSDWVENPDPSFPPIWGPVTEFVQCTRPPIITVNIVSRPSWWLIWQSVA